MRVRGETVMHCASIVSHNSLDDDDRLRKETKALREETQGNLWARALESS